MSSWGKVDFKELQDFQEKLESLPDEQLQRFITATSKELAGRLIQKVQGYTLPGQYPAESGKVGGTLRRGWTGKKDMDAFAYAMSLPVVKQGSGYLIKVINPVEYASFVEYGHRQEPGRFVPAIGKRLKKGWVEGRFMLTRSEMELERDLPHIIEKKLTKFLTRTIGK